MKIMGHRGARDRAPENTLRSFQALIESKAPAVEFDIHSTRDGFWVVHHDETLERTTTGEGRLGSFSWSDLQKVTTKEGDPLPLLTQALELFRTHGTEIQVEVKSTGDFKKLGGILLNGISPDQLTVISFNHRWLLELKSQHPQIRTTCLLFALPVDPVAIAHAATAQGLSMSVNWIDQQTVNECHRAGLTVTAWNANDEDTFKKMKLLGVDYLGTDRPFEAMTWK